MRPVRPVREGVAGESRMGRQVLTIVAATEPGTRQSVVAGKNGADIVRLLKMNYVHAASPPVHARAPWPSGRLRCWPPALLVLT